MPFWFCKWLFIVQFMNSFYNVIAICINCQWPAGSMVHILLTNLQPSQSESLFSRLFRDQRERRLGEGLCEEERDGGWRRPCVRLSPPCSSLSRWESTVGEGLRWRTRPSSTLSSLFLFGLLPQWRFGVQPWSSSFRFFVRLRWERLWRVQRDSLGLGERDQDSVSEDGGRTVSVGTGMGWDALTCSGTTGEVIVIFRACSPDRASSDAWFYSHSNSSEYIQVFQTLPQLVRQVTVFIENLFALLLPQLIF